MDRWNDYNQSFAKAQESEQHQHNAAIMETMELSPAIVKSWQRPPFQRPVNATKKIQAVAEEIKKTGVIEGVITLGRLRTDVATYYYVVDGQHRLQAFLMSGLPVVFADVRKLTFDTIAEMAEEYVLLNSSLVRMRPDDILRGLESATPLLATIRSECPFVSYDNVRRGPSKSVLSMSAVLRCWCGSASDIPTSMTGVSVPTIAGRLNKDDDGQGLIGFLTAAHLAWGSDHEYYRLWGTLNLSVCMWLWRRLVLDRDRSGAKRYALLTPETFKECLMALSADGQYLSWLIGRNITDRDRSPCYTRVKTIVSRRLNMGSEKKHTTLPSPIWASK